MTSPRDHVGALLRRERQAAGMTERELALYLGVSVSTLIQYEQAVRPPLWAVRMALSQCQTRPLLVDRVRRLYTRESAVSRDKPVVIKKNHHSPQSTPRLRRCSASGGSFRSESNSGTPTE